ncbi:MAG TPA: DUF748 domain-containing protein [Steroidobacteraceae bacterium]|jgi:hypothetical protein|nr:DUF748 domain-containing protein [Steroidobacteraceae bacterium]
MERRYRRYLIGIASVLVLVGAYAAAGLLALPYFIRKSAVDFVRTHYHRTLTIGEVRFNPFTLALDMRLLLLPDADGQTLLSLEHLHVTLQLASLWRLGASFGDILLERPYVRAVIRPDGELNFADLGKGFPPAPPAPKPSPPPRVFVKRLAVLDGAAVFEDRTRPTPFRAELKPIVFELRDFSTRATTGNGYALEAASPEGERFIWNGTVHFAPLASRGVFEVANLKARTVWNYLRSSLPFEIASGTIGLKGDYDFGGAAGPRALSLAVHNTTVDGLGVRPHATQPDYIDVARIAVEEIRVDLMKQSVSIAKVALSGGDIKAWLNEERRLNLLELFAPPGEAAAQSTAAATATAPSPAAASSDGEARPSTWKLSAPDLVVEGFRVSAEDRALSPAAALTLAPLNVHVTGFNTSPENTLDVALDTGVDPGGKIHGQAKVTPRTTAVSAHIEVDDLALTLLQPYLTHYTSMTLLNGTLGAKLDIERTADGTLVVGGKTGIHELRTIDNALKLDFVKWRDLRIADIRYRSAPASLRIGAVTALEPYVRMVIAPDRSTNIKEVLTPAGAPRVKQPEPSADTTAGQPAAEAAEPAARAERASRSKRKSAAQTAPAPAGPVTPFPVSIGTVTLANGSANYADLWIKPSFAIGIQSLGGNITGLNSDPQSRAKVQLEGKVDRYAPWKVAGEVNVLSAALFTDLTMGFKDVDLTVVNPYSGHFVGYKIDKGKLSVEVHYKIEQRKLAASQHFVVDQLELGERVESPDAVHVPLKIAVALLKDRNGVIDLDLPMSGSLDDPQFRIGPIIWKAFVNVLTKVATAPFALLGHMFGGGNEHLNVIEFAGGSAELEKPAQDQLGSLAKALQERPQLKLDVPMVSSDTIDRPALAAARLRSALLARAAGTREGRRHPDTAGEMALADPEKHFKLLLAEYQAQLGKDKPLPPSAAAVQQAKRKETPPYDAAISELEAALLEHVQVPDGDLEALAQARAQAIQGTLVSNGQIDPSRLFLVNAAAPKPQSGDTVKIELALKLTP